MAWVTVSRYATLQEAQMAKMSLGACGINALIPDETSAGVAPHFFLTKAGVRLQVDEGDADEAKAILAAPPPNSPGPGQDEEP